MTDGCVTNFDHGEGRLTIWKSGERFRLERYGGGEVLPLTYDSIFQSIAAEMYRLAREVGRLRRGEMECGGIDVARDYTPSDPSIVKPS